MLVLNGLAFSLFIQQWLNAAVIAYQAEKVMDSAFGACTAVRLFVYNALIEIIAYITTETFTQIKETLRNDAKQDENLIKDKIPSNLKRRLIS